MGLFSPSKQEEVGHITVINPGKGSEIIKLPFAPTVCKAFMVDAPGGSSCRPHLNGKLQAAMFKKRYSWFIKISWENLEPGTIKWVARNYDIEEL
jgi:hypothetical protein